MLGIQLLKERDFVATCMVKEDTVDGVTAQKGCKRKKTTTAVSKRKPARRTSHYDGGDDNDDDDEEEELENGPPSKCRAGQQQQGEDITSYVIAEATKIVAARKAAGAQAGDEDIGNPGCDDATYRNTALNSLHYGVVPSEEVIARRVVELKKRDESIVAALMFQAAIDCVLERLGLASSPDQPATLDGDDDDDLDDPEEDTDEGGGVTEEEEAEAADE
jgi:hypothetical protein